MALKQSENSINAYEGFRQSYGGTDMYNTLGGDKGLSDAISSNNDSHLNAYLSVVMDADKLNMSSFKSEYNTNFLDTNEKLSAAANELYGDRETQNEYTRYKQDDDGNYVFDDDGNPVEETYYDTEYNYTKAALKERSDKAYEEYQQQCLQAEKDGWSGWKKFWSSVGSFAMNFGATVLDTIKDDLMFIGVGIESIWNRGALQRYYANTGEFEGWGAGVLSDLMADFDTQYSILRNADGSTTTLGNVLYGTANTFGVMIPSMLTNMIPVAGQAGSIVATIGNVAKQSVYWFSLGVSNIKDYAAASPNASFGQIVATSFGVAACQAAVTYVNALVFGGTVLEKAALGINSENGVFSVLGNMVQGGTGTASKVMNSGIMRFITSTVTEGFKQWYEEEWQEACQAIVENFSSYCNNNFNQIFELSGSQYMNAMGMAFLTSFISMGFKWCGAACTKVNDYSQPLLKNGDVVYNKNALDENGNLKEGIDPQKAIKYKKLSTVKSMDYKQTLSEAFKLANEVNNIVKETQTVEHDAEQMGPFNENYVYRGDAKTVAKLKMKQTALVNAMTTIGQYFNQAGEANFKEGIEMLDKINTYNDHLNEVMNAGGYTVYISQMLESVYAGAELKAIEKCTGELAKNRITQLKYIIDPLWQLKEVAKTLDEMQNELDKAQEEQHNKDIVNGKNDPELIKALDSKIPDAKVAYETARNELQGAIEKSGLKVDLNEANLASNLQAIVDAAQKDLDNAHNKLENAQTKDENNGVTKEHPKLEKAEQEAKAKLDKALSVQEAAQTYIDALTAYQSMSVQRCWAQSRVLIAQAKEQVIAELREEYKQADAAVNDARIEDVADNNERISNLTEYVNDRIHERDELQAQKDSLKARTKEAAAERQRLQARIDVLNKTIDSINDSIAKMQTENRSHTTAYNNAVNQRAKAEARLNNQAGIITKRTNSRVKQILKEQSNVTVETDTKLNAQIDDVKANQATNDTRIKDKEKALVDAKAKTEGLRDEAKVNIEKNLNDKSIEQRQSEITTELNQVESDLKAEQAKTQGLEEQAKQKLQNTQNTEIDNAKAEQTRLNNELTVARNQTQSIREQALQRLQEAGPTEKELKATENKQNKAQNKLDKQKNREIKSLKSQRSKAIEAFNKEHAQKVSDLETARDNEIKAANDRIAENEKQIADIQQKIAVDQADVDTRTEENERLKKELAAGNTNSAVDDILNNALKSVSGHSDLVDAINRVIAATANSNMPILAALTALDTECNNFARNNDRDNGWSFYVKSIYETIPRDYKKQTAEQRHNDSIYKYAIKDDARASDIFDQYGNLVNNISVNDPIWKLYDALLDYAEKRNPSNTDPTTPYNIERARYAPLTNAYKSVESLINIAQIRADKIAKWNYNTGNNFYKNHKSEEMQVYTEDIEEALQRSYKYYTRQSNTSVPAMSEAERITKQGKINTNDLIIKGKTDSISKAKQGLELLEKTNTTEKNTIPNIQSTYAKRIQELNDTDTSESINADYDSRIAAVKDRTISMPETHERTITEKDIDNDSAVKANQEEIANLEKQLKGITIPETKEITDTDIQNDEAVKANKAEIERLQARQSELLDEQEGKIPYKVEVSATEEQINSDEAVKANAEEIASLEKEISDLKEKKQKLADKRTELESQTPETKAKEQKKIDNATKQFINDDFKFIYDTLDMTYDEIIELSKNNTPVQTEEEIGEVGDIVEDEELELNFEDESNTSYKLSPKSYMPLTYFTTDMPMNTDDLRKMLGLNSKPMANSKFKDIFNSIKESNANAKHQVILEGIYQKLVTKDNDGKETSPIIVTTEDGNGPVLQHITIDGKERLTIFIPEPMLDANNTVGQILKYAVENDILYTIATGEAMAPFANKLVNLFETKYNKDFVQIADIGVMDDNTAQNDKKINAVANLLYNAEFMESALVEYGEEVLEFMAALPDIYTTLSEGNVPKSIEQIQTNAIKMITDNIKDTLINLLAYTESKVDHNTQSHNIQLMQVAHNLTLLDDEDYFKIIDRKNRAIFGNAPKIIEVFDKLNGKYSILSNDRSYWTSANYIDIMDQINILAEYMSFCLNNDTTEYNTWESKDYSGRKILKPNGKPLKVTYANDKTVYYNTYSNFLCACYNYLQYSKNTQQALMKVYNDMRTPLIYTPSQDELYNTSSHVKYMSKFNDKFLLDRLHDKDMITRFANDKASNNKPFVIGNTRYCNDLDTFEQVLLANSTKDYIPMFDNDSDYVQQHSPMAVAFNQMLRQYGFSALDVIRLSPILTDKSNKEISISRIQKYSTRSFKDLLKQQYDIDITDSRLLFDSDRLFKAIQDIYYNRTGNKFTVSSTYDIDFEASNKSYTMSRYNESMLGKMSTSLPAKLNKVMRDTLVNPALPDDIKQMVTIEDIIYNPHELLNPQFIDDMVQSINSELDTLGSKSHITSDNFSTYDVYKYLQNNLYSQNISLMMIQGRIIVSDISNFMDMVPENILQMAAKSLVNDTNDIATNKGGKFLEPYYAYTAAKAKIDTLNKDIARDIDMLKGKIRADASTNEIKERLKTNRYLLKQYDYIVNDRNNLGFIMDESSLSLEQIADVIFDETEEEQKKAMLNEHNYTPVPDQPSLYGTHTDLYRFFKPDTMPYKIFKNAGIQIYFVEPNLSSNPSNKKLSNENTLGYTSFTTRSIILNKVLSERRVWRVNSDINEKYGTKLYGYNLNILYHEAVHSLQMLLYKDMYELYVASDFINTLVDDAINDLSGTKPNMLDMTINNDIEVNNTDVLLEFVRDFIIHGQTAAYDEMGFMTGLSETSIKNIINANTSDKRRNNLSFYEHGIMLELFKIITYIHSPMELPAHHLFLEDMICVDYHQNVSSENLDTSNIEDAIKKEYKSNDPSYIAAMNLYHMKYDAIIKGGPKKAVSNTLTIYTPWGKSYDIHVNGKMHYTTGKLLSRGVDYTVNTNTVFDDVTSKFDRQLDTINRDIIMDAITNFNNAKGSTKSLNDFAKLQKANIQSEVKDSPTGIMSKTVRLLSSSYNANKEGMPQSSQVIYQLVQYLNKGAKTKNGTTIADYSLANYVTNGFRNYKTTEQEMNDVFINNRDIFDSVHQYLYKLVCGDNPSIDYQRFLDMPLPYYIATYSAKDETTFDIDAQAEIKTKYNGGIVQFDNNMSLEKIINTMYNREPQHASTGKLAMGTVKVKDILFINGEGVAILDKDKLNQLNSINVINTVNVPDAKNKDYGSNAILISPHDEALDEDYNKKKEPNSSMPIKEVMVHKADHSSMPMPFDIFKSQGMYINYAKNIASDEMVFDFDKDKVYIFYRANGKYKILEDIISNNSHFMIKSEWRNQVDTYDNINLIKGKNNIGQYGEAAWALIQDPHTNIIIREKLEQSLAQNSEYKAGHKPTVTTVDNLIVELNSGENIRSSTIAMPEFIRDGSEVKIKQQSTQNKNQSNIYSGADISMIKDASNVQHEQNNDMDNDLSTSIAQQETQEVSDISEFYDESGATVADTPNNTLNDKALERILKMSEDKFAQALAKMSYRNYTTLRSQIDIYLFKLLDNSDNKLDTIIYQQARAKALSLATQTYRIADYILLDTPNDDMIAFFTDLQSQMTGWNKNGIYANSLLIDYYAKKCSNNSLDLVNYISGLSLGDAQLLRHELIHTDLAYKYLDYIARQKNSNSNPDMLLSNIMTLHESIDHDCAMINDAMIKNAVKDKLLVNYTDDLFEGQDINGEALVNLIILSHDDKVAAVHSMSTNYLIETLRDDLELYIKLIEKKQINKVLINDLYDTINAELKLRTKLDNNFIDNIDKGDKTTAQFSKEMHYNIYNRDAWLNLIAGRSFGNGIQKVGKPLQDTVSFTVSDLQNAHVLPVKSKTPAQQLISHAITSPDFFVPYDADKAPSLTVLNGEKGIKGQTIYAAEFTDSAFGKTISYAPIFRYLMGANMKQLETMQSDLWEMAYTFIMGKNNKLDLTAPFTLSDYQNFAKQVDAVEQTSKATAKKAEADTENSNARFKNAPLNKGEVYNTIFKPLINAVAAYTAYLNYYTTDCKLKFNNITADLMKILYMPQAYQYDYLFNNVDESDYATYKAMLVETRNSLSDTDALTKMMFNNLESVLNNVIDTRRTGASHTVQNYYQKVTNARTPTNKLTNRYNATVDKLTDKDLSKLVYVPKKPSTISDAKTYKNSIFEDKHRERADFRLANLPPKVKIYGTNDYYALTDRAVTDLKSRNTNIDDPRWGFKRKNRITTMSPAMQGFIVSSDMNALSPIVTDAIKETNFKPQAKANKGRTVALETFSDNNIRNIMQKADADNMNDYTFQQINKYFYGNKYVRTIKEFDALKNGRAYNAWILCRVMYYVKSPNYNKGLTVSTHIFDNLITEDMAYDPDVVDKALNVIDSIPELKALKNRAIIMATNKGFKADENGYMEGVGPIEINSQYLGSVILNRYNGTLESLNECYNYMRKLTLDGTYSTRSQAQRGRDGDLAASSEQSTTFYGVKPKEGAYSGATSYEGMEEKLSETDEGGIGAVKDRGITRIENGLFTELYDRVFEDNRELGIAKSIVYDYVFFSLTDQWKTHILDSNVDKQQVNIKDLRYRLKSLLNQYDLDGEFINKYYEYDFDEYLTDENIIAAFDELNESGELPFEMNQLMTVLVMDYVDELGNKNPSKLQALADSNMVNEFNTHANEQIFKTSKLIENNTKINTRSLKNRIRTKIQHIRNICAYNAITKEYANTQMLENLKKSNPNIFVKTKNGLELSEVITNGKTVDELINLFNDLEKIEEKLKVESTKDERIKQLEAENKNLRQEVKTKRGEYNKQQTTINKQKRTIEAQRQEIEEQSAKYRNAQEQISELIMRGQTRQFVFGMRENDTVKIPEVLKEILSNTVSGLDVTPANVQLGQAGGEYLSYNIDEFFTQNKDIFARMTQADWEDIIDYFCADVGMFPVMTNDLDAYNMYMIYRVWLLAYAQMNAKDGLFRLDNDTEHKLDKALDFGEETQSKLNQSIEGFGSQAGRYLNAFKQATDLIDPRREIIMQTAKQLGISATIIVDAEGNPINTRAKRKMLKEGILDKYGNPVNRLYMAEKTNEYSEIANPSLKDVEDAINLLGDVVSLHLGESVNIDFLLTRGIELETITKNFGADLDHRTLTITKENKPILLGIAIQNAAAADLEAQTARSDVGFLDRVFAWEQMCMLSWPGTWIRNWSSNLILQSTNKIADMIGKLFGKGKKTQQKLKNIEEYVEVYNKENEKKPMDYYMYQIQGTKPTADIQQAVKSMFEDDIMIDPVTGNATNFWGVLSSSVSRYSDMQNTIKGREMEPGEKMATLIINSLTRKIMAQNKFTTNKTDKSHAREQFENVMNKTSNLLFKALSDDPWIKHQTRILLEKMLTERNIAISDINYMNDQVMNMFAEAYTEASWEYMHRASPMRVLDKGIKDKLGKAGWFVWKQMMPFANATWNWGMEALNYSPVGLIRGIYQLCTLDKQFYKTTQKLDMFEEIPSQNFTLYNARKMIGKGVVGTLLMAMGMMAAGFGIIGLDKEDDKIKIKIGDSTYIDVSNLFGTSSFLAGAGLIYTLCNSDEDTNKKIWSAINTVFDSLLEDSIFNSLFQSFEYSTTIGDWVSYNLVNSITAFIPNLWKKAIEGSYDFSIQYNSGFLGQLEKMGTKVIPGLAYAMPKKYDIYTGESKSTYKIPFLFKWLNNLSPVDIEPYRMSDIEAVALSLGINKGLLTGQYDDIGTLTTKQRAALNKMYGELNDQVLNDLINGKISVKVQNEDGTYSTLKWRKMTEAQKASAINSLMSKNATYAKAYVFTSYMGGKYYATDSEYTMLRKYGITHNIFLANDKYSGFILKK